MYTTKFVTEKHLKQVIKVYNDANAIEMRIDGHRFSLHFFERLLWRLGVVIETKEDIQEIVRVIYNKVKDREPHVIQHKGKLQARLVINAESGLSVSYSYSDKTFTTIFFNGEYSV